MSVKKSSIVLTLVIIAILAGLGLVAYTIFNGNNNSDSDLANTSQTSTNIQQTSEENNQNDSEKVIEQEQPVSNDEQNNSTPTFDTATLASFNGQNGALCYVAVNGKVYDVSESEAWNNGRHVPAGGSVTCGRDLSSFISQSPHGTSVLQNVPEVGTFQS